MNEVIEIPLSKNKLVLLSLGALLFVAVGIFFIVKPENNSDYLRILGIASVSFFALCLMFFIKKLFDKEKGLIINENGIVDNSSGVSVGLIEWTDIEDIETIKIASTKLLLIQTDKPEKYIARAKNVIAKQAMRANLKMYGTPLTITSNSLKIKFDELENLVLEEFRKREKFLAHSN